MAIRFATGFEVGVIPVDTLKYSNCTVVADAYSGDYALQVGSAVAAGWIEIPIPSSGNYKFAAWLKPSSLHDSVKILFRPEDNGVILQPGGTWNAAAAGFSVFAGTIPVSAGAWHHLQFWVQMAAPTRVVTLINNAADIDEAAVISAGVSTSLRIEAGAGHQLVIDDIVIDDANWPGLVRFWPVLRPSQDVEKQWTNFWDQNYVMVGHKQATVVAGTTKTIPVSTTVYAQSVNVEGTLIADGTLEITADEDLTQLDSAAVGDRDMYRLDSMPITGMQPRVVLHWLRGRGDEPWKHLLRSVATEVAGSNVQMVSDYEGALLSIHEVDPHTGTGWTKGRIDNIRIGQEVAS